MALHTSTFLQADDIDSTPTKLPTTMQSVSSKPAAAHVKFSPEVTFRATIHIDDYSGDEVAACWYNRKELKAIRLEGRTTVIVMENKNQILDNDRMCSRGLESYTPQGIAMKQFLREEARNAVLDEQYLQYGEEDMIYDPEMIADIYFTKTRSAQAMARTMGRADEEWVREQDNPAQKKTFAPQLKAGINLPSRSLMKLRRISSSAA
jgi:hypothetical protein